MTRKTINTVERGVFVPSTVLALRLAEIFEVPVEAVFWLEGKIAGERGSSSGLEAGERPAARVPLPALP